MRVRWDAGTGCTGREEDRVLRIFPFNAASRALCRACGFREVGVYEKHGRLDGEWIDVVIVERLIPENLDGPGAPPMAEPNTNISNEE